MADDPRRFDDMPRTVRDLRTELASTRALLLSRLGSHVHAGGGGGGSTTINTFQPLATEAFVGVAGASQTVTLSQTNYATVLVFLNGQQLQPSEYSSPTATTVTVTPVEVSIVSGDRIVVVFAKAAVYAGTYADDIEITTATKGVVLKDRVNGNRYRLFMSGGVLGTELA